MAQKVTTTARCQPVRVFVSYAWEDDEYRKQVADLAAALRHDGINARLDRWDLQGLSIPEFMNREVRHADKILVCASPKYKQNVHLMEDGKVTGSGWEAMLITSAIWTNAKNRIQFEVVIIRGSPDDALPAFLSGWPVLDLTQNFEVNYRALVRRLTGHHEQAPPLGEFQIDRFDDLSTNIEYANAESGTRRLARLGFSRYLLDRVCPRFHIWLRRWGVVSTPDEYGPLVDHLTGLRAYLQQEIQAKTYIENIAKRVPKGGPGDDALVGDDPFALPIQRVIRVILGGSQGGDSASAQLAAVNRRSRVVTNLLKTLRRSREPLMLLGDPGTGKTLTLQQAALAATSSELRRVFPTLVLYIRLGEFHVAEEGRITASHVLDYVRRSVPDGLRPLIDALDFEGRLIIFFDGLDEMSRERYTEHTAALSEFAGRYSYARHGNTKTLFSCRITDFSPSFRHERLVLLPFEERQIREYLNRSFPGQTFIEIEHKHWTFKALARAINYLTNRY